MDEYKVYSCGYQLTAMYYFHGTGLPQNSDVPFYPPPNNASAGACCQLYTFKIPTGRLTNLQHAISATFMEMYQQSQHLCKVLIAR